VHGAFGIENKRGLSNILSSDMNEAEMLNLVQQEKESGLYLLTSGPVPPNPAELIGSEQMRKVILELGSTFDHIFIDTPPIASFTDGVLLASISDGVILVIHANECSRKIVQRSRQALVDVGAKVLGVVLNRVNVRSPDYYYSYSYYSNYKNESDYTESAPPA
jgi:capsular exopolysaccharide synthesis family protein